MDEDRECKGLVEGVVGGMDLDKQRDIKEEGGSIQHMEEGSVPSVSHTLEDTVHVLDTLEDS